MIPTNKSQPEHLRMKGTRCTRKTNEKGLKRHKNHMLQQGNQHNHESFHTLGGQILYKLVKKIYAYGARK
jgi:hypothetical protein